MPHRGVQLIFGWLRGVFLDAPNLFPMIPMPQNWFHAIGSDSKEVVIGSAFFSTTGSTIGRIQLFMCHHDKMLQPLISLFFWVHD